MEFSIYLDAGSRRKVTRYFHSAWWLRFVSESPVRVAGRQEERNSLLRNRPARACGFVLRLFTLKIITHPSLYPPSPPPYWNHEVRRKFSDRSLILKDL